MLNSSLTICRLIAYQLDWIDCHIIRQQLTSDTTRQRNCFPCRYRRAIVNYACARYISTDYDWTVACPRNFNLITIELDNVNFALKVVLLNDLSGSVLPNQLL